MSKRVWWTSLAVALLLNKAIWASGKADLSQVALEVRIISAPEVFFERIGMDFEQESDDRGILNDQELIKFLECAQGDQRTNVMQLPKVTLFQKQETDVRIDKLAVKVKPTISDDMKNVRVEMHTDWAERGVKFDKELVIPEGRSALVYAGKRAVDVMVETSPPVIGKIPFVGRLTRKVQKDRVEECTLVLVTPRVLVGEPETPAGIEEASEPEAKKSDTKLKKLLASYEKACKAGNKENARKIAVKALKLDPTCFSNNAVDHRGVKKGSEEPCFERGFHYIDKPSNKPFDRIHGGIE